MSDIMPQFYELSNEVFGNPARVRFRPHNVAEIFQDLLDHTPTVQERTRSLPTGLVLDLLHAQLPVLGAHLAAQYLRQLTAFRKQYPSYTVFKDPNYLGSPKLVKEVGNILSVSQFMEADFVALDALKNLGNPTTPVGSGKHQHMYGFFVHKMSNYIPYFALRPLLTFANLQTLLTRPDDQTLEFILRALTPYYLVRDVDLEVYQPDAWVDQYFAHNAPQRWGELLQTPLVLP